MRLALLNTAQKAEDTRENFRRELDADLDVFHCPSGELPGDLRFDGFVVTGSWASVYWDREWIGQLKTWVGDAVRAGLPALGVCYGHQLLADVMGGRVEGMGEYEIGYREVRRVGDSTTERVERGETSTAGLSSRTARARGWKHPRVSEYLEGIPVAGASVSAYARVTLADGAKALTVLLDRTLSGVRWNDVRETRTDASSRIAP